MIEIDVFKLASGEILSSDDNRRRLDEDRKYETHSWLSVAKVSSSQQSPKILKLTEF